MPRAATVGIDAAAGVPLDRRVAARAGRADAMRVQRAPVFGPGTTQEVPELGHEIQRQLGDAWHMARLSPDAGLGRGGPRAQESYSEGQSNDHSSEGRTVHNGLLSRRRHGAAPVAAGASPWSMVPHGGDYSTQTVSG